MKPGTTYEYLKLSKPQTPQVAKHKGASYIKHSIRIMEWESVWIEWINFNVKFKADLSSKNKALLAVTPIWYLKTAYPSKSEFSWNM